MKKGSSPYEYFGVSYQKYSKSGCIANQARRQFGNQLQQDAHFQSREQAMREIVEYIGYYNTDRRHSALGNVTPAQFERRWGAESNQTPLASPQ